MVWRLELKEGYLSSLRRGLHRTAMIKDSKKTSGQVSPTSQPPSAIPRPDSRMPGDLKGVPTALDKIFLVWSGQFKAANEIPKLLDGHVIHRARSWGRIRINVGFLFIAAAGGGLMVYLGKQAAARGESLEQQNIEWHRKIKEDYESENKRKQG